MPPARILVTWALLLAAALGLRIRLYSGVQFSDDVYYLRHAQAWRDGTFRPIPSHFATRLGLVLPLAAIQEVTGLRYGAGVVLTLAASLGGIALAGLLGTRLIGVRAGFFAGAWVALLPTDIYHATWIAPHTLQSAILAGAACAWLWNGWEARAGRGRAIAVGALLGLGYFVKETTILVLVPLALHALTGRKRWVDLAWAAAGALAFVAVEMVLYTAWVGDPLFRITAARAHYEPTLAYYPDAAKSVFHHVFVGVPWVLAGNLDWPIVHFGLAYGAVAVSAVSLLVRRDRAGAKLAVWWVVFMIVLFGTPRDLSLRPANMLLPGYFLALSAPAALLVGRALDRALESRVTWAAAAAGLAVLALAVNGVCAWHLNGLARVGRDGLSGMARHFSPASVVTDPVTAEVMKLTGHPWPARAWDPTTPPPERTYVLVNRVRFHIPRIFEGASPPEWLAELQATGRCRLSIIPGVPANPRTLLFGGAWRGDWSSADPSRAWELWDPEPGLRR